MFVGVGEASFVALASPFIGENPRRTFLHKFITSGQTRGKGSHLSVERQSFEDEERCVSCRLKPFSLSHVVYAKISSVFA